MRFRGWWGYLLALMLVAAACTGESLTVTEPAPSPTAPPTTATPPTTSSSTSTSTSVPPEVRLPANDVDDPTEAIVAILEYVSYLHTIPESGAEYLDLVYLPTCDCYEAVTGSLAEYVANGWTQDDSGIIVHEAVVTQTFANGDVLVQVDESWSPQWVLDPSGTRKRLERDDYEHDVSLIAMELGSDGRWRAAVISLVGTSVKES